MFIRRFENGSNGSRHLMENFEYKYFKYPSKLTCILNKVTGYKSQTVVCSCKMSMFKKALNRLDHRHHLFISLIIKRRKPYYLTDEREH